MRVNAGIYKDKLIECPKNAPVRPTTDKVKESIFNLLRNEIEDSIFVDLFAGSGSVGIEALSRGAKKVYFCDINDEVIQTLKKNLSFIDSDKYEIIRGDYISSVKKLKFRGVKADIIFLDPPYNKDLNISATACINDCGLLKTNGILVCEREVFDLPQRQFYAFLDTRTYSHTCIDIYKNISKCAFPGSFDPFTLGHEHVVKEALKEYDFVYITILDNEDKKASYSIENRIRMIEQTCKEYKDKIRVEYYKGLTYKYCQENGIDMIFRGIRNDADFEYEEKIRIYNNNYGRIGTKYIQSENDISSSFVREKVLKGESVEGLVSDRILSIVKKIKRS